MVQRILFRAWLGIVIGVFSLIALPVETANGQQRDYFRLVQRYDQPQIYYQSMVLPQDEEHGMVGITFRIPHTALVFTKTPLDHSRGGFVADVEVVVEIYQNSDRVDTRVFRKKHYVSSYESSQQKTEDLTGGLWFNLPPGDYRYRFEVNDRNTETTRRRERPREHEITVPAPDERTVHPVILARSVDTTAAGRLVEPHNLSGDFVFGTRAHAVVPVTIPAVSGAEDISVHYILRRLSGETVRSSVDRRESGRYRPELSAVASENGSDEGSIVRQDSLSTTELLPVDRITVADSTGTDLVFRMAPEGQRSTRGALVLDLKGRRLTNDTYVLEIRWTGPEGGTKSHTTRFAAHWRDMPISLYDLDVAIDHLSYIADEKAVDHIEDGNREERFREFWKKRDPTPETPFNELMAEYYQRIDYAADEFRTGRIPAPDGLQSARARIYIVNGPPASKERTNPERGIVRETWTYEDGRRYVFEASSGFDTFRLVDEQS
jgi:GWxTD domain-containing protein